MNQHEIISLMNRIDELERSERKLKERISELEKLLQDGEDLYVLNREMYIRLLKERTEELERSKLQVFVLTRPSTDIGKQTIVEWFKSLLYRKFL